MAKNLGFDEKKRKQIYFYLGALAVAFVPFVAMLFRFANTLTGALVALNQPGLAVVLAVMGAQMVVVFFGVSHLMSSLYYSEDLELLRSFPLTPWQIMTSKILSVYVGQLVFGLIASAPFLICLGINLRSVSYWPLAIVVFLLIPAVPLAVSLLILAPMMKLTAGARKRDFFRVLFGLLIFVLMLGFQYINANLLRYGPEELTTRLMEKDGLIQVAAGYYPLLKWAAWCLTGVDRMKRLLGLVLYAALSVGSLGAVSWLGWPWFLGGLAGGAVREGKKHPSKTRAKGKSFFAKPRPPILAIMLRDHRMILRTPNFLLTALVNLMILPIIFLTLRLTGGEELAAIMQFSLGPEAKDLAVLIMVGVHGLFTSLSQISSTGLSREGSMFWFSKLIPVPPKIQVRAKLAYSLLFSLVQLFIFAAAGVWILKIDGVRMLIFAVLGLLVSVPINGICLLNDLQRPKLNWTEPQQAMKGNLQTMVATLFALLYLGLLTLMLRGFQYFGASAAALYLIGALSMGASSYVLIHYLDSVAAARYMEL